MPGGNREWSAEASVAAAVGAIGLMGTLLGLAGHAYVLSDHVSQLESAKKDADATHMEFRSEMASIKATASTDRAASDKREALIEKSLGDINEKLSTLQTSVDQLPSKHH